MASPGPMEGSFHGGRSLLRFNEFSVVCRSFGIVTVVHFVLVDCAAKLFDRVSQISAYILLSYRSDVLYERALICPSIFIDWN